MKRLPLPALLLATVLGAKAMAGSIDIGLPVLSGNVSMSEHRESTGHADLSPKQLQALSQWFEQHKSGWQGMVTPATNEPIQMELNLTHSDGGITSVCVIDRSGGGHYLRLTGPGKWAYRSIGGIFKSWAAIRALSDKELAALLNIVSAA